jgi:hypothetical protein
MMLPSCISCSSSFFSSTASAGTAGAGADCDDIEGIARCMPKRLHRNFEAVCQDCTRNGVWRPRYGVGSSARAVGVGVELVSHNKNRSAVLVSLVIFYHKNNQPAVMDGQSL